MSSSGMADLPRSATWHDAQQQESRLLSDWASESAYVLLGEPGSGKSTAFRLEAEGEAGGALVTARDFANGLHPTIGPGQTLFIDGLDEMRAGSGDREAALDRVIQRLVQLGKPRFRLSCREADWFTVLDHRALAGVAPGGDLRALHLDPLNDEQVLELIGRQPAWSSNPQGFVRQAESRGVAQLLRNPLLLDLLAKAVGPEWPRGREGVYRLACDRMATEQNETIRSAKASSAPLREALLDDAGLLCAVLLISGRDAFVHGAEPEAERDIPVDSLPMALGLAAHQAALASNLFVADGERRLPRHRTVAEYLAARAIGRRVAEKGLPLARVLALMSGHDGGIVEPLRGLHAWLSVTCPADRPALIDADPLACVLYGDVREFTLDDKRRVLQAFQREAEKFVWFRAGHWESHPYGALGTADMAGEFGRWLIDPRREPEHQSVLDTVLDAVRHGEAMPTLLPALEAVVRDDTYDEDVRSAALGAWLAQPAANLNRAFGWLREIQQGQISDSRDELCGRLLKALYPEHLFPCDALDCLHEPKAKLHVGGYLRFWDEYFIDRTPDAAWPTVADALASTTRLRCGARSLRTTRRLVGRALAAALRSAAEPLDLARVWTWLGSGVNEYGRSELGGEDGLGVRSWFEQDPSRQKALVAYGYGVVAPDPRSGGVPFWIAEQRLFGARRPADWYQWQLQVATQSADAALSRYCLRSAAAQALSSVDKDGAALEPIEAWVRANHERLPEAAAWLEAEWSMPLEGWQQEEHLRTRAHLTEREADLAARHAEIAPALPNIESGDAAPVLMCELTWAYRHGSMDVEGDTPEARVESYLGVSRVTALRAIEGIRKSLARADLPSAEEVLAQWRTGHTHFLTPVMLLAAELDYERAMHSAVLRWTDALARSLVASFLVDGDGSSNPWYLALASFRPALVAEVLECYATEALFERRDAHINGLWSLGRDDGFADVARLVIPRLVRLLPCRLRPSQWRRLNDDLIPAAVRHLPADALKNLVREKLDVPDMDSAQHLSWLMVGLRFAPHRCSGQIVWLVGGSRVRRAKLTMALASQGDRGQGVPTLPALALGRLIALIAPAASPDFEAGRVRPRGRWRDLVRALLAQLGSLPDDAAGEELARLRQLPDLSAWKVSFDATRFDHARLLRGTRFSLPTVRSVAEALSGRAPATPLDMAALLRESLSDLQQRMRGDDTNRVRRLFWRKAAKQGLSPFIENDCRDELVAQLRGHLQQIGVSLQKEASHADDSRADMRAECSIDGRRVVLPVEIKKEDHPALWTAWRDQLEALYTIDPDAGGVGLYLVLWFNHRPRASADSVVPRSPQEMAEMLEALIPARDRARLQVHVLDLSLSARAAARSRRRRTGSGRARGGQ